MIPEAAVEAAAEWLPHAGDCEVRPERDCTCWKSRVDLMRAALEAAAPHMLEDAWEAGAEAMERSTWPDGDMPDNPYR